MQMPEMNKLAHACHHCSGRGATRYPRSIEHVLSDGLDAEQCRLVMRLGPPGVGFRWLRCEACAGRGGACTS